MVTAPGIGSLPAGFDGRAARAPSDPTLPALTGVGIMDMQIMKTNRLRLNRLHIF